MSYESDQRKAAANYVTGWERTDRCATCFHLRDGTHTSANGSTEHYLSCNLLGISTKSGAICDHHCAYAPRVELLAKQRAEQRPTPRPVKSPP